MDHKVCALSNLSDVSNAYLNCYLTRMSSSTEYYIRHTILSDPLEAYSRDSPEFFAAVRIAASVPDCVNPASPLDVSRRSKYEWSWSSIDCAAQSLHANDTLNSTEVVLALCPPRYCLGAYSLSHTPTHANSHILTHTHTHTHILSLTHIHTICAHGGVVTWCPYKRASLRIAL